MPKPSSKKSKRGRKRDKKRKKPRAAVSKRISPVRTKIFVRGVVQGVGFRPFIYNLAKRLHLKGWVLNTPEGVQIDVEGERDALEDFLVSVQNEKPRHAFIQSLEWTYLDTIGFKDFQIKDSKAGGKKLTIILPDISTCELCLEEMWNPSDRRHRYPFINCTLCGPRFSIIENLPYDRPNTSMKKFRMCSSCEQEYTFPEDRRFHAQPTACPTCGPWIELIDSKGKLVAKEDVALTVAYQAIKDGLILGLKGLGGFLLIVDASNNSAVERLRRRKMREEKPLALMYSDIASVKKDCIVNRLEERLLTSPERPIVLLKKSAKCTVSEQVAPANPYLGVMLPYTPLHQLLMDGLNFPLIATSGNLTDEPMAIETDEAISKLSTIADMFLTHNRPIVRRMDDSIARIIDGREVVIRRARGYAPLPIEVGHKLPQILALGGHLKNTIAISIDNQIYLSQHIGDLETKEAIEAFQSTARDFQRLYDFEPEVVAVDMHPGYASTRFGEGLNFKLHRVQHHLAHVYSVMADNGLEGSPLGISWDGTGHGEDRTVWGGEFIMPNEGQGEWMAGFEPFPLIGGEKAIKEPRRTALGLLYSCYGKDAFDMTDLPTLKAFSPEELEWMKAAVEQRAQSPMCRSVGRLFDGVCSILGIRQKMTYEGQAAMALEFAAKKKSGKIYPFDIKSNSNPKLLIDWRRMLHSIIEDTRAGIANETISSRFHATLSTIALRISESIGEKRIVLSGGCFQNAILVHLCRQMLSKEDFEVYTHQRIPPNDGGISLGQVIATSEAGI